jgi:FkbM family methyltransferase
MLISAQTIEYLAGSRPNGVLHVGAHEAEEQPFYAERGWGPVTWVEMIPDMAEALRRRFAGDPNNTVIEAACWSSETDILIRRASNNDLSSSLLEPLDHLKVHPQITFMPETHPIRTKRLDGLLPSDAIFDFIAVDTQGAELEVLRGLGDRLTQVRMALVEVNEREHYSGCPLLPDLDRFFVEHGFVRAFRARYGDTGWGDGIYIRISDLTAAERRKLRWRSRLRHIWGLMVHFGWTPLRYDNWRLTIA